MIIVTGAVTTRPGEFKALHREALAHVHRSRQEPGCILHAVHVDAENAHRLVFLEKWDSLAALKIHFKQAGSIAFMQAVRALDIGREPMEMFEASALEPRRTAAPQP